MIRVPFCLELSAIAELPSINAPEIALHKEFINRWNKHGTLIMGAKIGQMSSVIENLAPAVRHYWKKAFAKCPQLPTQSAWPGIDRLETSRDVAALPLEAKVFFVSEATAVVTLDWPESQPRAELHRETQGRDVEVCRVDCVGECIKFREAEEDAQAPIAEGTPVQSIWHALFRPFAESCEEIVVVDRYACSDANNNKGKDGLEFFLRSIDHIRKNRPARITLYVGFDCPNCSERDRWPALRQQAGDLHAKVADIQKRLTCGGVVRIRLVPVEDGRFGHISHQRFIRFDNWITTIDIGMEVFGGMGGRVPRTCGYSVKTCFIEYGKIEKELKESAVRPGLVGVLSLTRSAGRVTMEFRGNAVDIASDSSVETVALEVLRYATQPCFEKRHAKRFAEDILNTWWVGGENRWEMAEDAFNGWVLSNGR